MSKESNPTDKFNFLLGAWKLEYKVPESRFSAEDYGEGEGRFERVLNGKYVTFDYHSKLSRGKAAAHAIFAWDHKSQIYRYWWFEDSGEFMEATCDFINEGTLCLNWHNSLLVQTFKQVKDDEVILQMSYPSDKTDYEIILEVKMTRIKEDIG